MTGAAVHRLRVATYNLRGLQDDVEAAARVVRTVAPDVLLVQEAPRLLGADRRLRTFASSCGLRWPGRSRRLSGTTVMLSPRLVAGPVRDLSLPVPLLGNPRGYTMVRVGPPAGPQVAAVSVHLPLEPSQRRRHVRQVLSELHYDLEVGRLPWVVGGDLNEDATGTAWQLLAQRLPSVGPSAPTFPARGPRRTIDAVFASPELTVLRRPRVELDPQQLGAASDHLPVWVDLAL